MAAALRWARSPSLSSGVSLLCKSTPSRAYSTSSSPKPLAYISRSSHPHFNLSLEHFLLRSVDPNTPLCLLYRNEPCIVIGRNQNPWMELDVTRMRELGIRLVRRRSGGGAVYHDLGNTNYSFHIAREAFTRQQHAELVARALNSDPVSLTKGAKEDAGDTSKGAYVNKRNDICIALKDRPDDAERKISGSAYKIISSRAYHHGTMLLSSNLSNLGSALKPSRSTMQSKGVESVPSPVSNLTNAFVSRRDVLHHDHFCQAVVAEFHRTYGNAEVVQVDEENYKEVLQDSKDELQTGWREMNSWDWIWGQTPEFHNRVRCSEKGLQSVHSAFEVDFHVKNGIIQSAILRCDSVEEEDAELKRLIEGMKGKRYDVFADAPDTFGSVSREDPRQLLTSSQHSGRRAETIASELLPWLKTVL